MQRIASKSVCGSGPSVAPKLRGGLVPIHSSFFISDPRRAFDPSVLILRLLGRCVCVRVFEISVSPRRG